MIRIVKILSVEDSGSKRMCRVSFDDKEQTACLFNPYGLFSSPLPGSMGIGISQNGNSANMVVIADRPALRPVKNLEQGEVVTGNYLTNDHIFLDNAGNININSASGSYIKLKADGDIDVHASGKVNIIESDINMTSGIIEGANVFNSATSDGHKHAQDDDLGGDTEKDTGVPI